MFNRAPNYESPTEKIRPCAHPLEALQNPGWSAQRHRRGRRCKASRPAQPNFSAHCRLVEAGGRCRPADEPGRLYPRLKTVTLQIATSSAKFSAPSSAEFSQWRPPLPPAAGRNTPLHATRLRLPLAATESLLSHPAPLNEHWPRAWGNLVRTTIVVLTISLLRRGARGLEGTALRGQRSLRRTGGAARHPKAGVGSATSFDCPARAAAVEDQPKQRKPQ